MWDAAVLQIVKFKFDSEVPSQLPHVFLEIPIETQSPAAGEDVRRPICYGAMVAQDSQTLRSERHAMREPVLGARRIDDSPAAIKVELGPCHTEDLGLALRREQCELHGRGEVGRLDV